jgi:HEAT repeat protein
LAKRAISEEKTKFRLRHRLVCSVLGKPDTDLFQLALQLGWLNQVGVAAEAENRGEKVYAFYHPTFQEYFAASAISDWHYFLNHTPYNPAKGTYHVFEPSWKEVILLWLGREDVPKEQKEEFIKALVEFEDGCKNFYRYRAYFLAAAGIAEFGDCSWADEIVAQVVKWSFRYSKIEKHKWWTFLKLIPDRARGILRETDRSRVIVALVELIKSSENKSTRWQAAESLGEICPGNPEAIVALVQLIESTQDEFSRWQAANSLGEICPGNQTASATLVQLIKSAKYEYIRREAVENLGKIDPGNPEAIAALVQLIESTEDEYSRRRAVESLEEIGTGNPKAIAVLVQLIKSTQDESIHRQAAYSLGKIDSGNPEAIAALVQLIKSTQDESIRWQAAYSLGEICPGNPEAIATLVQLIKSTQDESTRKRTAYSLGEIGTGNPKAIAALVQLIKTTQDESIHRQAAYSLGKIDPGNPKSIAALVQLIESTQDESIRWQAAESLGKIDPGNPKAIAVLVQLIESTQDQSTRCQVADSLGVVGVGNQAAIEALVQLIESTQDQSTRWQAANSLKNILRDEQLAGIVTALKDYLSDETNENDFERFHECYNLIWHCAQKMTYPDFYQTWHSKSTAIHPKVLETTAVGSNPINQSLNLAELPQTLASVIANDPALKQTIHLICIDGSKFIDPDNPAAEIYIEMVEQGCRERQHGEAATMQALKVYWKQLKSDKRVVLVFYENPRGYHAQGFSHSFLTALSKFDGAICVITSQTIDNIPLQCFSPNQAIADLVDWLK